MNANISSAIERTLDTTPYRSLFGKNVAVFDPSMDMEEVQGFLDKLHDQQAHSEFGKERYAILFRPGEYDLDVTVDYYVQAAGLGRVPSEVAINGAVQSVTTTRNNNVTVMFWRSAENFLVNPKDKSVPNYWAVSQAAPFRRMHVKGDLRLDKGGWASGGYLADTKIDGEASTPTGQQYFIRNSELGSWSGGNWNLTFVGSKGVPSERWPERPNTILDSTPLIREKPYLVNQDDGGFSLFVPKVRYETNGVSWADGPEDGVLVKMDSFHVAFPESDNADSINSALSEGKHILFTPGIYELEGTIKVERPDTILYGLGLPTFIPKRGQTVIRTADVGGLVIAGLVFDAGPVMSSTLLEIGPEGASMDHSENPTTMHDIYCRVGGPAAGKAEVCVTINSRNVVADHFWLWRADHGNGVAWDVNEGTHGLVVNGDDTTVYALFNEHFQGYQTLWNGERGRTYFYQSEIPYDPPSQEEWMNGGVKGFASYKVSDGVSNHHAWGLGIYSFFGVGKEDDPGVRLSSAIEVPEVDGIKINHVATFAGWHGGIDFPVNQMGETTNVEEVKFFDGINFD